MFEALGEKVGPILGGLKIKDSVEPQSELDDENLTKTRTKVHLHLIKKQQKSSL